MARSQGNQAELNRLVREILDILTRMQRAFQQLMPLFAEEKELLRTRQPERMEAVGVRIEQVLEEIRPLDATRQQLVGQLGGDLLGLPEDRRTIMEIDQAMGGGTGLAKARDGLRTLILAADLANRENQAIYQGILQAAEVMLDILKKGVQAPTTAYNRRGLKQSSASLHLFSREL